MCHLPGRPDRAEPLHAVHIPSVALPQCCKNATIHEAARAASLATPLPRVDSALIAPSLDLNGGRYGVSGSVWSGLDTARRDCVRARIRVVPYLTEHAVLVADAVTPSGQVEGGHGVEEARRQATQAAVAQSGIALQLCQRLQVVAADVVTRDKKLLQLPLNARLAHEPKPTGTFAMVCTFRIRTVVYQSFGNQRAMS